MMDFILLSILILTSGVISGLTLAILGQDIGELKRKAKTGNLLAQKVLPLREKSNWVLPTMLIVNVGLNSAVSILLAKMIGAGIMAGVIATVSIVIFAELLPQSIFNKYRLQVASFLSPLVNILMIVTFPISYPVSYILNKLLGSDVPNKYSHGELHEIVKDSADGIDENEKGILIGGLTFSKMKAIEIMTPVTQVFCLELNSQTSIEEIKKEMFSRIPVYSKQRDKVVGILYDKDLLGVGNEKIKVADYYRSDCLIEVKENTYLDYLLDLMIDKKNHMSFVYDDFGALRGIVTLEDITESIIQREIMDEHDDIADLQSYAKKEFDLERIIEDAGKRKIHGDDLPWRTYGKNQREILRWVKLSQCSTEHLRAILVTQPQVLGTRYEIEIRRILTERSSKETDLLSEVNGYFTPDGVPSKENLI